MQRMSNCNRGTAPDKAGKNEVNRNSDPDPSFFLGGEVRLAREDDSRGKLPSTTRNEEFAVARGAGWGGERAKGR